MIDNVFMSIEGRIAIGFGYGKTVKEAEKMLKSLKVSRRIIQ